MPAVAMPETSSLLALYRISRKDRAASHAANKPRTVPCRTESIDATVLDFVKTWRDIDSYKQPPSTPDHPGSTLDVGTLKWQSWAGAGNYPTVGDNSADGIMNQHGKFNLRDPEATGIHLKICLSCL